MYVFLKYHKAESLASPEKEFQKNCHDETWIRKHKKYLKLFLTGEIIKSEIKLNQMYIK